MDINKAIKKYNEQSVNMINILPKSPEEFNNNTVINFRDFLTNLGIIANHKQSILYMYNSLSNIPTPGYNKITSYEESFDLYMEVLSKYNNIMKPSYKLDLSIILKIYTTISIEESIYIQIKEIYKWLATGEYRDIDDNIINFNEYNF